MHSVQSRQHAVCRQREGLHHLGRLHSAAPWEVALSSKASRIYTIAVFYCEQPWVEAIKTTHESPWWCHCT